MIVVLSVVGLLTLLVFTYRRGRFNGHHDGYFEGLADGRQSVILTQNQSGDRTKVRAAYAQGYRRGLEARNESTVESRN